MEILQEMNQDFFNGNGYVRMKVPDDLFQKGITDIIINKEPRQIVVTYGCEGKQMEPVTKPCLEFVHPTVDQFDDVVDWDLETLTVFKGFIILKLYPHWNYIYSSNGNEATKNEQEHEQKISRQDINFVIDTMTKEAKHDGISIKQLFHGFNSGFTKTVIHANLNSKNAGAGKSYLLNKVSEYYPDQDVLALSGVSDKAFQHKEGIMVLEDKQTGELTDIEPMINDLRLYIVDLEEKLEQAKEKKEKSVIKQLKGQILSKQDEIKSIQEKQVKLIDLSNTIILLLDTPQDAVTDNLMSLLSNDTTRDQKYLFTDKSASGKLGAKYNILRGTPVMFTTRVIDDTRNARFEEKNRRFINITPNVSHEKIKDANALMWDECGLTPEQYDKSVVSRNDKEKAKKIIAVLVEKLKNHSAHLEPKQFGVKIPFTASIQITTNDVWSMTANDRMRRYLTIITKENMDSRPRLVRRDNPKIFLPISTFEDLKDTLELMEIAGSNVRPYLAQWYNDKFLVAFNDEGGQIRTKTEYINKDTERVIEEDYVAVTSKQLCEKTNVSNEVLRHKYIDPLVNQGLINKARSNIRKNENIYFPVDAKGENIFSMFRGQHPKLIVKDPEHYPTRKLIQDSFSFTEHSKNVKNEREKFGEIFGDKHGGISEKNLFDIYRLEDENGIQITLDQLVDRYFTNPESCFVME